MSTLVIDVGTSGVRAAVVTPEASVVAEHHRELLPTSPAPGMVEFDAGRLASAVLEVAAAALAGAPDGIEAVGIANQRASAVLWDRATGEPVGPGIGWQDLRTLGECLTLGAEGIRLAPNQTATKLAWLLDTFDPERRRDLAAGTIDTWVAWVLSGGEAHVTDPTNAAVTGLLDVRRSPWTGSGTSPWDESLCERLRIDPTLLPGIVDTSGACATAHALPGAPPICALVGDQQGALVGQGVVEPGLAKVTFGTGGMLDVVVGPETPRTNVRNPGGTFPIVTWRRDGEVTWGVEAIMLSAGTNVEWLRDDLGIIDTVAESDGLAASCADTGGVVYVPALLGLGTPRWDYGARGALLGVTRGTGRAEVVRAVLEGVAQRGADLVDATEADTGTTIASLRVDGGMSRNATFTQALADATGRVVEVSPVVEATTLGAGLLAGLATGTWGSWDELAATWAPAARIEPAGPANRERWAEAVDRAAGWIGDLSSLDF